MTKLNIALFCNGPLGEEYLRTIALMEQFNIVGYLGDADRTLVTQLNLPFFLSADELIEKADAIILVLEPALQFDMAKRAIKNLKHLFIETPLNTNIDEVEILLSMQREGNIKIQIGSGLRFNKSFTEKNPFQLKPQHIETQNFKSNQVECSTVLDLMIEDIDIALLLTRSEVRKISANAVGIVGDTPDLVSVRIEFGNGCVASLTANRMAEKEVHTTSIFQKDLSVSIDFTNDNSSLNPESAYKIAMQMQATEQKQQLKERNDHLRKETITQNLTSFHECIITNTAPPVVLYDNYRALKLAYQIIDKIEERGLEN